MSKRGNRGQRLICIFLLGVVLFNFPMIALFNVGATLFDIPVLFAYLFLAWAALTLLTIKGLLQSEWVILGLFRSPGAYK